MARRLNLTRNQLATFCKDFEQIRQFELLFAAVNSLLDSAGDGANLAPPVMENVIVGSGGGDGDLAPPVAESITYIQNVINAPDLLAPEQREDNSIRTDYIDFDREAPVVSTPGRLWWDEDEKTAVLALSGGNVELHLGQEELQDCYNGTGATLAKGTVVQVTGAQGNRLRIAKAQANAEATSVHTFGLVDESIANGAEGFVINSGLIRNLNTINDSEGNALTAGDTLYLSTTVAGGYTRVKPVAPDQLVIVGFAVRISSTVGSIFVKVDNGYEIEELHNVKVTAPVLAGSLLIYDATLNVWKNAQLTAGTGITITNGDASITVSAHVPVTLNASVTDVLSLTTQEIGAVDAGADRIVFWDDSANKTTYLAPSAPIQITGTSLEHATSGVAAATYGSATQVAQIAVNAEGHVTSASNVTISGVSPGGSAGGDLTGTYPNPTIAAGVVDNTKLADMPANTIKGNNTGSPADPIDLTTAQATAMLDTFTSSLKGLAPASGGGTSNYLRADGTWQAPPGTQDPVTIATSAADVLSVTGQAIGGVDPNADRMVFWDDSAGKLTYLTAGTNLSISGTSLNASVPSIPNNFGTIAVTGQSNVVADTTSDTLNIAASNMVAITTNATTDTVTIDVPLLSGDVTTTSAGVATISANAVGNTKLADMPANTIKGNNTGSSADPIDLTTAQTTAMLDTFTSTLKGLAPSSGGGTTNYLRADGTWQAPPGSVVIGASADAVLSASGNTVSAVDPGKNSIVVWDDTDNQLEYRDPGEALELTATVLRWIGGTATQRIVLRSSDGTSLSEPLRFQSGTNLSTPAAGAVEYNGNFYATPNTTTKRGYLSPNFGYWQDAAGTAKGPTIADYFPANSSIELESSSMYEITAFAYFLKTTAGTVTFTWLASSAPDMMMSTYVGSATNGFTTTPTTSAPVTGYAAVQSAASLAHAATGTLTSAARHAYTFTLRVETNAATNLRLRITSSAGTVTPQIGSYYRVIKILTSGSFAA